MVGERGRYLQGSGSKANKIPDNTTSEGKDNGIAHQTNVMGPPG